MAAGIKRRVGEGEGKKVTTTKERKNDTAYQRSLPVHYHLNKFSCDDILPEIDLDPCLERWFRNAEMFLSAQWRRLIRRLFTPLRYLCLPCASLTRSPGGRYMEWTNAFFEPCIEKCERSIYFIGLVSRTYLVCV